MKIVTLDEAREKDLPLYFTGKPCINGHISERYTNGRKCIDCAKQWFKENGRKRTLAQYDLTVSEYDAMLEAQDGKCKICETTEFGSHHNLPVVDHCHNTDEVRGLLCHWCNTALGGFKDDAELLEKAAEYIRRGGKI